MSPPEIWGPPIWTLFHTLSEKLNPHLYTQVINSMFGIIVRICKFLPCPECSKDAGNFLAKIKISDYKTKNDFKNMLYLFHNYVNKKKRKPLFNYGYINKYSNLNIWIVIKKFIQNYNTKGNMNLLTESFQRSLVIKDFMNWLKIYSRAFIQPIIINNPSIQPPPSRIIENENQPIIENENQAIEDEDHPIIQDEEQPIIENKNHHIIENENQPIIENEEHPIIEDEEQFVIEE